MPSRYVRVLEKKQVGRKKCPYEEQKISLTIYVRRNRIEELGGANRVRKLIYDAII